MPDRKHGISDWELWACARQLLGQHGDAAAEAAALRADALLAEGDISGHGVWLDILARIRQLTSANPDETRH